MSSTNRSRVTPYVAHESFHPKPRRLILIFERFTERARQVCVLAQDEARAARRDAIGTEHILIGLLREEASLAARVLESFNLTAGEVRRQAKELTGDGPEAVFGSIPFTPRAKRVLELSLREALSLGHNYIGTEHILLGLVRENGGIAAQILTELGLGAENIRDEVIRILSGPSRQSTKKPNTKHGFTAPAKDEEVRLHNQDLLLIVRITQWEFLRSMDGESFGLRARGDGTYDALRDPLRLELTAN